MQLLEPPGVYRPQDDTRLLTDALDEAGILLEPGEPLPAEGDHVVLVGRRTRRRDDHGRHGLAPPLVRQPDDGGPRDGGVLTKAGS